MTINKKQILLFLLLIITISWAYNYHEILFKRPMSFHTWRQGDCASIAYNYYKKNLPLLQPQLHNLHGNEGKGVGEFPIVYYTVGKLYKIFGNKEFIFRGLSTLLFFLGLFYLYRLALSVLKSTLLSLAVVALAFSSPIVIFYANNFLPDVHALSIVYIAWYYFARYLKTQRKSDVWKAILFFSLAGTIKVTALISLCVLICVMFYELFFLLKEERFILKHSFLALYASLVPFITFFAWLFFAKYYQNINDNYYFSLDWDPFWVESPENLAYIWGRLTSNWGWWPDMFWSPTFYIMLLGTLLLFKKDVNYFWRISIFAFYCGVIAFIAMYFSALMHHDYYLINLFCLVPFIYLFFFKILDKAIFKNKKVLYAIVSVFVFFNIQHADRRMYYRYDNTLFPEVLYKLNDNYLNSLGIFEETKILYDGENAYCSAFYLMNRYGWSSAYDKFETLGEIQKFKNRGADYLLVLGKTNNDKAIYKSLKLIDVFEDEIFIYKISGLMDNTDAENFEKSCYY